MGRERELYFSYIYQGFDCFASERSTLTSYALSRFHLDRILNQYPEQICLITQSQSRSCSCNFWQVLLACDRYLRGDQIDEASLSKSYPIRFSSSRSGHCYVSRSIPSIHSIHVVVTCEDLVSRLYLTCPSPPPVREPSISPLSFPRMMSGATALSLVCGGCDENTSAVTSVRCYRTVHVFINITCLFQLSSCIVREYIVF